MKDVAALLIGKKGMRQAMIEKTAAQLAEKEIQPAESLPVLTLHSAPGCVVARQLGIVSGEGTARTAADARETALENLRTGAAERGANAVLGVSLDHVLLASGEFLAVATGTASIVSHT